MSAADVTHEDIVYLSHPSGDLLARIYQPAAGRSSAAVVSLHGGRWIEETRLTNAVIDRALAAAGALVMAIDIRLPPVARYPDCLADIHYAVRWLKSRARLLGIPPSRVGGVGTSSGGHQMMLLGLRPRDPRYAALPLPGSDDAALAFVMLGWPVIDPLARYRYAEAGKKERYLEAHHAYWPSVADMEEGNPQLILERGEPADLPPVLMIQGTADEALTPDMADRFAAAYLRRGGNLELVKFDSQPHTFVTKQPDSEAAQRAIARMTDFLRARSGTTTAKT